MAAFQASWRDSVSCAVPAFLYRSLHTHAIKPVDSSTMVDGSGMAVVAEAVNRVSISVSCKLTKQPPSGGARLQIMGRTEKKALASTSSNCPLRGTCPVAHIEPETPYARRGHWQASAVTFRSHLHKVREDLPKIRRCKRVISYGPPGRN